MLIAQQDFRDEECFIPRGIFLDQGAQVKIISLKKGTALGIFGGVIDVDITLDELNIADFNCLVLVGGNGALTYLENNKTHQAVRQAVELGKILAAICIAPTILARAGVLKGKKAVVWSSNLDKSAVKILQSAGAEYTNQPVVIDGNIITADGPESSRAFAEAIVKALSKE